MAPPPTLSSDVEEHRDHCWCRDATRSVSTVLDAERFVEQVYYAKLARGRSMFVAPRMIPHFHAIGGVRPSQERRLLSPNARAILTVLRGEWEMASSDLRTESGITDRVAFTRALDELQAAMIVVPSEAVYVPKFTYLWTLAIGRFPDMLSRRVKRQHAVQEIARCFLAGAGTTVPGELARVIGLSLPEAGRGNRALVAEGYAAMPSPGTYTLVPGDRAAVYRERRKEG